MSDYFSTWVEAVATTSKTGPSNSKRTLQGLCPLIQYHVHVGNYTAYYHANGMELPRVLSTDNGSEFKNKLNAEMNKLLG